MGLNKLMSDVSALIAAYNTKKTEIDAAVTAAQTAVLANNKAYYVDPVAGLDTNAGTQAAPFKTLKKACDSVPIGGFGDITIIGDGSVTCEIENDITIYNKVMFIRSQITDASNKQNMPKIINKSYTSGAYQLSSGFFIRNSSLSFINIRIATAKWPVAGLIGTSEGVVKRLDASSCTVFLIGCKISISDTPFVKRPPGPAMLCVGAYGLEVEVTGEFRQPGLVMLEGMPAILGFNSSILPAGVTWNELIKGMVYHHATGMPLNVISNLDLSLPST